MTAPAGGSGSRARDELADQTAYGNLYLGRLRRAQLGLSLVALAAFAVLVGLLPLALLFVGALSRTTVLGLPLGALLVAVGAFPLFVLIALLYRRRAEALEESFRKLLREE